MSVHFHLLQIDEENADGSNRLWTALIEDLIPSDGVAIIRGDKSVELGGHLTIDFLDPGFKVWVGCCIELGKH